jgi:hypothetical protein
MNVSQHPLPVEPSRGPSSGSVVAALRAMEPKLLVLYHVDQIDADGFATEQQRLKSQITNLESEINNAELQRRSRDHGDETVVTGDHSAT